MQDELRLVDFEFTLAMNNATGKYFVCLDAIESCRDLIRNVWYWRLPLKRLPPRLMARILGRLARDEINYRLVSHSSRSLPLMRNVRPVVFTDPREVILYKLKGSDVVLCHDMGPITHPDLYDPNVNFLYETAFKKICEAKPLLVFVSQCSRNNFVALYGDDYPSMKVIYPALRGAIEAGCEEPIATAPRRFLLTVGALGWRKNYLRSLEAFAKSKLADEGYNYVICGGPEPGFDAVAEAASKMPAVIMTGYVNDKHLRWLYTHASGFVLPSLLEGFGLPAAEAISRNLVPLLSKTGVLQEVAGDAAILVDPFDVDEIANGMRRLVDMEESERQARLVALRQSIARFSRDLATAAWRATIEQALGTNVDAKSAPRY